MINLAGNPDCDLVIRKELNKASIPIVPVKRNTGEVKYSFIGKLGPFEFHRCWYYWRVSGLIPLHVAKRIYWHPDGQRDVRAAGHCGCPHPNKWTDRFVANGEVWPTSQRAQWDEYVARHNELGKSSPAIFSDDPTVGLRYVTSYDIDTQAGLRLFAKIIRRYGLDRSVDFRRRIT